MRARVRNVYCTKQNRQFFLIMADNDSDLVACEEKITVELCVIKEILYKDRCLNICDTE